MTERPSPFVLPTGLGRTALLLHMALLHMAGLKMPVLQMAVPPMPVLQVTVRRMMAGTTGLSLPQGRSGDATGSGSGRSAGMMERRRHA